MCGLCPRNCNADRKSRIGICGMGIMPVVAKAYLHMWEEPCISGTNGSGTVFFTGCNLKCIYCQNAEISQGGLGKELTINQLSEIFLRLQGKGAHNINLVNPTHFITQIKNAIELSKGLEIPVVYNSNGFECIEGLKKMEGVVDVYLPDIKYYTDDKAKRYSMADNYFNIATEAVLEMYSQVGGVVLDSNGVIRKGLVIRHLILPGMTKESVSILNWIKSSLPGDVMVSLMSQYTPYHKSQNFPEINRRITRYEYEKVLNHFLKLGFENGYVQERDSAEEQYIPTFDFEGVE